MFSKKVLIVILAVCLMIACMPLTITAEGELSIKNNLATSNSSVDILPFTNRVNKTCFYLPSNIDLTKVEIETSLKQYSFNGSQMLDFPGNHVIDVTPGETIDTYGNTCYMLYLGGKAYFIYSGSAIGSVYVKTSGGINPLRSSKNYKDKNSQLVIANDSGTVVYDDISLGTVSEIKGRGNASFSNEKKPFQIKLGKKTDLFGMGKAKTWILLANYNDSAYIRNTCVFKIAQALELPYTPNSVFVDLYIDSEYQGLYQLCEKTQIGENRIEITDLEDLNEKANKGEDLDSLHISTHNGDILDDSSNLSWYRYADGMKNPDNITGGYLIELDNLYSRSEKCVFQTHNDNQYTIKSPEVCSQEEMDYIANLFCDFEQALYSETGYNDLGKHYTEYCDLESLVKVYVVEEISKNWDAYIGSIFFHIDTDGMLHAGPVWDFDNTWGNIPSRGTYGTNLTEPWANGASMVFGYVASFGKAVIQHEDAKALASTIYPIAAKCLEDMLQSDGYIDTLTELLSPSAHMDMMRWPVEKRSTTFRYFRTYSDESVNSCVGFLRNFMAVRTEALYDYFDAEHEGHVHSLEKVEMVEPTCTESGTAEYWECSSCHKKFSDALGENRITEPLIIEPFGHDWGEWKTVEEPTVEKTGLEMRVCSNDPSHTEMREIPKLDVTTSDETTETTEAETTIPTETETDKTDTKDKELTPTAIVLIVSGVVLTAFAVVLVVIVVRKKKH